MLITYLATTRREIMIPLSGHASFFIGPAEIYSSGSSYLISQQLSASFTSKHIILCIKPSAKKKDYLLKFMGPRIRISYIFMRPYF